MKSLLISRLANMATPPLHNKKRRAVLTLTLLTIVWGTTFAIVQDSFSDISPLLFAALRFAISLAIFLSFFSSARKGVLLLFTAKTPSQLKLRKNILIVGSTLGFGYIFQFLGLITTTTSKSAFLTSTTVLWTPLFARMIGFEKFTPRKIISITAAGIGIVLLTHPYPFEGIVIGDFLTLLCALAFGVYILWLDKTFPLVEEAIGGEVNSAIALSAMQLTIALFCILIVLPFTTPLHFHLTNYLIFSILYTTILATAASSFIQALYQKEISPTAAVLIYTLEPVVTALIGYLIVGERMNPSELVGCGLIISAMLVGQ